jgi:hypothetical protein
MGLKEAEDVEMRGQVAVLEEQVNRQNCTIVIDSG